LFTEEQVITAGGFPLFPLLAPHFTVCAMDRRGHGESEAGTD
jgi:pimeloyl-ACP methyl ester carboxylesterase